MNKSACLPLGGVLQTRLPFGVVTAAFTNVASPRRLCAMALSSVALCSLYMEENDLRLKVCVCIYILYKDDFFNFMCRALNFRSLISRYISQSFACGVEEESTLCEVLGFGVQDVNVGHVSRTSQT